MGREAEGESVATFRPDLLVLWAATDSEALATPPWEASARVVALAAAVEFASAELVELLKERALPSVARAVDFATASDELLLPVALDTAFETAMALAGAPVLEANAVEDATAEACCSLRW